MKRIQRVCRGAMLTIGLMGLLTLGTAVVQAAGAESHSPPGSEALGAGFGNAAPYIAIAVTMGTACLAAAYAVGKVGAAALGAAAEKPELLGKAIVFVGLGEGIAIFGLIISLMLINKL
ncbi:MAG: H+transporting two-sector ATPase C subunit [Lentisphaeria bacterium]|nr:H+transporting two-sector ATPase C subunit [Lentisphaeria bacterium]